MWSMPQKRRQLHLCVCVCVCVCVNFMTTFLCQNFFSSPLLLLSSVVFIHPCSHQGCHAFPYSACHTSPRQTVVVFRGLMRGGMPLPCSCVRDAVPSLPEPASHHRAERLGRGLLSWSPLALRYQPGRLCDEHQSGRLPPLRGEPEQSSAGEHSA